MKFRMIWLGQEDEPDRNPSPPAGMAAAPDGSARVRYEQRGTEMVRREQLGNGRVKFTAVANFSARIVRDIICDDDTEQWRNFGVEAELAEQKVAFVVPAAEFNRMNWVLRQLGPQAIIYPGQQQQARAAIQCLSGSIRQERIFAHVGWRKHGEHWMYLHAAGAVSVEGALCDLQMQLPAALQHYHVRPPADRGELVKAVRTSLGFLSVAPDRITFPLLAAVYRAPLGGADFSVFLTGGTGTFKTALAAVCQQHFGAAMDANHLPANFASTANALEDLAFCAKDALMVVDDFAPTGGTGDSALHAVAERLFRAAGNRQGRNRMGGQVTLRPPRPPRALVLGTGEAVPRGHSLRARLLIVELRPGEVDRPMLTRCQRAGQDGQLAAAMAAYLAWIAGSFEELQERMRTRVGRLRGLAHERSTVVHPRLPTTLAELQSAWEIWLQFAREVGAISRVEQAELEHRGQSALAELAALQVQYHQASDPALRFVALLRAALASGRAHVADRHGEVPESPGMWGWRRKPTGRAWVPQGTRIGWVVASDLFLEPAVSYQVAQQMAGTEHLPVSAQTLRHRLREHGLLASLDVGRQMLLVRRTLEGIPRQVLHLNARDFVSFSIEKSGIPS